VSQKQVANPGYLTANALLATLIGFLPHKKTSDPDLIISEFPTIEFAFVQPVRGIVENERRNI